MTLDEALLAEVDALRTRLEALEDEVFALRTDFRDGVRRLHSSGGSLREIAAALNMSHQRVHQIVGDEAAELEATSTEVFAHPTEPAAATGAPTNVRVRKVRCSFCNASQAEVKKLIAGPGYFMCAECVAVGLAVITTGETAEGPRGAVFVAATTGTHKCNFCGKRVPAVKAMAVAGRARICDECLQLCADILEGEGEGGGEGSTGR